MNIFVEYLIVSGLLYQKEADENVFCEQKFIYIYIYIYIYQHYYDEYTVVKYLYTQ